MENIMNFKRIFLPLLMFAATLMAADIGQDRSAFQDELNETDFQALRDFINTKRTINLKEKMTHMIITGDVRSEWRYLSQKGRFTPFGKNNILRGGNAVDLDDLPISHNDFDAEANLYFEYNCDRSYAVLQIQFDNSAGVFDGDAACSCKFKNLSLGRDGSGDALAVFLNRGECIADPEGWHGSGRCNSICLKKAYFGYNLFKCGDHAWDIELGRRRLNNVFDSKVQFGSQFDGITFKYSHKGDDNDSYRRYYFNIAGFVVNQRVNQFAWALETGFYGIYNSNFDVKYSFIDWRKFGRTECYYIDPNKPRNPSAFNFLISQITIYYNLNKEWFCGKPAQVYVAGLMNHARRRFQYVDVSNIYDSVNRWTGLVERNTTLEVKHSKTANLAWYAGFKVGEVKKEGDWSLEIQYQYVEPIAVPDNDVRGICRGNVLDYPFTSTFIGNTNFKGWKFEGLYAFTDNITVDSIFEWSRAVQPEVGGHNHYTCFKLEAIYAF